MPSTRASLRRRATSSLGRAALVLAAILGSIALLGSCAGERPTLGARAPQVPDASTTIASTTTTPAAPTTPTAPADRILGPDDLLGWIATPQGDPKVHAAPADDSALLPIEPETDAGAPTVLAVVGDASATAPRPEPGWLEVALPSRPNGSTGWVREGDVTLAKTPLRLFVDLEARTLRVERDGIGVFTTTVAIGTDENPTPTGGTYVIELVDTGNPDGAYGRYAYGLAMHSETLTEFAGGEGRVGIHGTNQPDLIGQAVSHGCVRLNNQDVQELLDLELPLGVPVFVT